MKASNLRTGTPGAQGAKSTFSTAGITYITDSGGRRIGIKKLSPSERYALADAVDAKNQSTEMQAIVAASVVSIGDEGYPAVVSRADLLTLLDDLGDEGLAAIAAPVILLYGAAIDEKAVRTAKNS